MPPQSPELFHQGLKYVVQQRPPHSRARLRRLVVINVVDEVEEEPDGRGLDGQGEGRVVYDPGEDVHDLAELEEREGGADMVD